MSIRSSTDKYINRKQGQRQKLAPSRSANSKGGILPLGSPSFTLQPWAKGHTQNVQNSSTRSLVDSLHVALSRRRSNASSLEERLISKEGMRWVGPLIERRPGTAGHLW